MPQVEIDEAELAQLRQAKGLLNNLLNDPRTKRNVEKEIKVLVPTARTTEDYAEPYVKRMDGIEKKLDTFLETFQNERQDSALTTAFAELTNPKGDWGLTDDGLTKVKQIMVEKKIADPYAAAALFERQNPPKPQLPSGLQPTGWGIGAKTEDKELGLLFADEDTWLDHELGRIFTERQDEA